jgi:hypothetical protein
MEKVIEKLMEILMQKLMEKVIEISGQFSDGDRDGEISNGEINDRDWRNQQMEKAMSMNFLIIIIIGKCQNNTYIWSTL